MKPDSSILITRNLGEQSPLRDFAQKSKVLLIDQPFIRFEGLAGLDIPVTEWIFFSSPTAMEFYLDLYEIKAKKIAVYGEGTGRKLKKHGLSADFTGDFTKVSSEIAVDFFRSIGQDTVLFPISDRSLKNIPAKGPVNQVHLLTCYKTIPEGKTLHTEPNVIIFTSPSNVEGYLINNQIKDDMTIVAFGQTTADYLKSCAEGNRILVPKSPAEKDIIALLNSPE